jgi:peptidoglycan/LPS O-acetylase OafA/YrhL
MEGNLPSSHWQSMLFNLVQPIAAVCVALVISISKPVLASAIQRIGNCSYEMYLFHFPIIQLAVLWALPFRFNPAIVFSLTMLSVFVISYIYNKGYSSFKNYISNDHRN